MLVAEEGAAATKELSATNRTEKYLNFDVKYFLRYFSVVTFGLITSII